MKKVNVCVTVLVLLAVMVFSMGCGKKAQEPSPAKTTPASPAPSTPVTPGTLPSPTEENSFSLICDLSYEDGTQPVAFKGGPDLYEFSNMKAAITLNGKTHPYNAVVKKEGDKWIFGTLVVVPEGKVSDYKKVDSIVFKTEGYKDVEFKDVPIVSKKVDLQTVVIKK